MRRKKNQSETCRGQRLERGVSLRVEHFTWPTITMFHREVAALIATSNAKKRHESTVAWDQGNTSNFEEIGKP